MAQVGRGVGQEGGAWGRCLRSGELSSCSQFFGLISFGEWYGGYWGDQVDVIGSDEAVCGQLIR